MYSIIDTFTLCMSCTRWYKAKNVITGKYEDTINWSYTAKLQQKITSKMFQNEQDKQNMNRVVKVNEFKWKKAKVNWHRKYKGYVFNYYENWHSLTIMVPHYKLEDSTAKEIVEDITAVIIELFDLELSDLNEIVLNRLDIKVDFRYADETEYEIIKNVISKVADTYYCYQKNIRQDSEEGYLVTFTRPTSNDYSKGPVTSSTKTIINKEVTRGNKKVEETENEDIGSYLELAEYNKTLQIEQDIAKGKVPVSYREKYINVFRTEVRLRNSRLNYYKNNIGITKTLDNYCNDYEFLKEIYTKPTKTLFGTKDFFRIDIALEIIKGSNKRQTTKDKLCTLIELINKNGYTKAKNEWIQKYCDSTFRNNVKQVEKLGINVITFDKEINKTEIKNEIIKNFTLIENRIPDTYNGELKI